MRKNKAPKARRYLLVLALLPLTYFLLLPSASEQGLAAGLLAPAGLERTGTLALALVLLQLRLLTVWLWPGFIAVAIFNRLISSRDFEIFKNAQDRAR